ncbi:MAG: hypothetical protein CXR31_12580 [Geobacter sp.]|nr:MAG: hypothetical protein CXR31_12580 [Geobacter sp.]
MILLCNHKPMILNWFKAKGRLSSGAVEGLDLKSKLTIRKAYTPILQVILAPFISRFHHAGVVG